MGAAGSPGSAEGLAHSWSSIFVKQTNETELLPCRHNERRGVHTQELSPLGKSALWSNTMSCFHEDPREPGQHCSWTRGSQGPEHNGPVGYAGECRHSPRQWVAIGGRRGVARSHVNCELSVLGIEPKASCWVSVKMLS